MTKCEQSLIIFAILLSITTGLQDYNNPFIYDGNSNSFSGVINIAGVFTRKNSAGAEGARIAIKDINKLIQKNSNQRLLTVNLLEAGETQCNPEQAESSIKMLIADPAPKPIILAGCIADCRLIANEVASSNAIVMCYGISKSPLLGSSDFPETNLHVLQSGLFLAQPDLSSAILPLVKFVQHFGWRRVAILCHDSQEENYCELAYRLSGSLSLHKIDVYLKEIWSRDEIRTALDSIKTENFRVILTVASEISSREILCHIYHQQLYGSGKYVWIFLGSSGKEWFLKSTFPSGGEDVGLDPSNIHHFDCKPEQLIRAADGHFTAQVVFWNANEQILTVADKTVKKFRKELMETLRRSGENIQMDFDEGPLAYDSVWGAYLALTKSISDCQSQNNELIPSPCEFISNNLEMGQRINRTLSGALRFQGMSGDVSFYQGVRSVSNGFIKIEQYKNRIHKPIASHFNFNNTFSWIERSPFDSKVPDDGYDEVILKPLPVPEIGLPFPQPGFPLPDLPSDKRSSAVKVLPLIGYIYFISIANIASIHIYQ